DEVNALIFDFGSSMSRIGYAGEESPRLVFPTLAGYYRHGSCGCRDTRCADGAITTDTSAANPASAASGRTAPRRHGKRRYYIGESAVYGWRPEMEVVAPVQNGVITDWDAYAGLWDWIYDTQLRLDPREHPLLLSEAALAPRADHATLMQLAFEQFDVPALYLARAPVLSAFALGRPTALVLDVGMDGATAAPVVDGYPIRKATRTAPVGGSYLDALTSQLLADDRTLAGERIDALTPAYLLASRRAVEAQQTPAITLRDDRVARTRPSFHRMSVNRVVAEFKEMVLQVAETPFDASLLAGRPAKAFEFPNGYNRPFGPERFRLPESLFDPAFCPLTDAGTARLPGAAYRGLPSLVQDAIQACDVDVRPQLWNSVVVVGGTTLVPGFNDRLRSALEAVQPGVKIKVHSTAHAAERRFSSWLGGSILGSLGTFHQLWITKEEYEEKGFAVVDKRLQ
ncbi:hypothetical protein CXG81DRAFT_13336, partial [Caulochytrium protostelioides]